MQLYKFPIQFLLLNAIKMVSFENFHSKFQTNRIIDFLISFRSPSRFLLLVFSRLCLSFRYARWIKSVCPTFVPMNHTRRNLRHPLDVPNDFIPIDWKWMNALHLKNTDGENEDETKEKKKWRLSNRKKDCRVDLFRTILSSDKASLECWLVWNNKLMKFTYSHFWWNVPNHIIYSRFFHSLSLTASEWRRNTGPKKIFRFVLMSSFFACNTFLSNHDGSFWTPSG